jgi:hypothetical protein
MSIDTVITQDCSCLRSFGNARWSNASSGVADGAGDSVALVHVGIALFQTNQCCSNRSCRATIDNSISVSSGHFDGARLAQHVGDLLCFPTRKIRPRGQVRGVEGGTLFGQANQV